MQRVKLGHTEIIADPKNTRPQLLEPQPSSPHNSKITQVKFESLAEAQTSTEVKLWQPAYLPSTEMRLAWITVVHSTSSDSDEVVGIVSKYRETEYRWLVLEQNCIPLSSNQPPVLRIPFEIVIGNLGNRPAIFYTFSLSAPTDSAVEIKLSDCMWEYEEYLMRLHTPNLSFNELIQVGESLQ